MNVRGIGGGTLAALDRRRAGLRRRRRAPGAVGLLP
jgi:hypothetical protein